MELPVICTTLLIGEELLKTKVLKKVLSYDKFLNSWGTGKNIVTTHSTRLLNLKSQKTQETLQEVTCFCAAQQYCR